MRLWDALTSRAPTGGPLFVWSDGRYVSHPWADCVALAERRAGALRRLGVESGHAVGCVLDNSYEAIATVLGIWLAGGTVASLPRRERGTTPDGYASHVRRLCSLASADVVVVPDRVTEGLATGRGVPGVHAFETLEAEPGMSFTPPSDDAVAFVQFTSGSTGSPRGCMLTTRAIETQLNLLADRLAIAEGEDRAVSWLPLSHDMGLFGGLLTAWAYHLPCAISAPSRFVGHARSWFGDCAAFEATLTTGPSSALEWAARAMRGRPPDAPLRLRSCIVGAERIEARALDALVGALARAGLSPGAIVPAYGLAEATLAVTVSRPGAPARRIDVDLPALDRGSVLARDEDAGDNACFVSCGPPLEGVDVRIEGSEVGQIVVRSPSLATGYAGDSKATAERFRDGWLFTSDVGFLHDGELYVVGRSDDVLSVGGRNVYAGEIEAYLVESGLAEPGAAAIVDVPAGARHELTALVEIDTAPGSPAAHAQSIDAAVRAMAGVGLDACLFLEPRSLPRTSSGKLQRFRCRELARRRDGLRWEVELRPAAR